MKNSLNVYIITGFASGFVNKNHYYKYVGQFNSYEYWGHIEVIDRDYELIAKENKFKIGDKVKFNDPLAKVIYIVKGIYGGYYQVEFNNGMISDFTIRYFEENGILIEEKKMNKFKVGDKIEWKGCGGLSNIEVIDILRGYYTLSYEDKSRASMHVKYIDDNYQLMKNMKIIKIAALDLSDYEVIEDTISIDMDNSSIKAAVENYLNGADVKGDFIVHVWKEKENMICSPFSSDGNFVNTFNVFPDMTFKVKVSISEKTIRFVEN
jgi:hypothetical protein